METGQQCSCSETQPRWHQERVREWEEARTACEIGKGVKTPTRKRTALHLHLSARFCLSVPLLEKAEALQRSRGPRHAHVVHFSPSSADRENLKSFLRTSYLTARNSLKKKVARSRTATHLCKHLRFRKRRTGRKIIP